MLNRMSANYKRPQKNKGLINAEEFNDKGAFPPVTAHATPWMLIV
jgi:hypothetical protein